MSWYCPLPFRHAFVDSTGVGACCNTPRYPVSLEDWANDPRLHLLQQQLLDGSIPTQCSNCVKQEASRGRSLRTDSIRDYNEEIFTDTKISFIDYRSSNICNFKCRSCSPEFSHGIAQEVRNSQSLQSFHRIIDTKTVSITDTNHEWIINNLDQIDRLMFTGGEPTVIPNIKNIIEAIVRNHSNRIQLLITTNASFTDKFWYDLTDTMPNLHWTVSIDAVGKAAEVIRHGTLWNVVEHNVRWLSQHATSLDINSVITNLNVLQLKPLLKFAREMQQLSITPSGKHGTIGCRHQFYVSQRPYYLAATNWPDHMKPQVQQYLEDCLTLDLDAEQYSMISGLLDQIKTSEFDARLWDKTQYYNSILNENRKEDHTQLYQSEML